MSRRGGNVKSARLRILGALFLAAASLSFGLNRAAAQASAGSGKLAGVVRDASGVARMGATVELLSEASGLAEARDFLTNGQGIFRGDKLAPGFYTLRVTLAGFLPSLERHVRIAPNFTTVVRIELDSMFASLDQLRRQPVNGSADADDWKWVLRSAPSMRPVLEWMEDANLKASRASMDAGNPRAPRARLEFTGGARRPPSPSNFDSSPATAFAYDQKMGYAGHMIFAGQMSYKPGTAPAGEIATLWLPAGSFAAGPHTALALREARWDAEGPTFRGVRIDQGGTLALTDRAVLTYGTEYVLVGLGTAASSLRPRAELDVRVSGNWQGAVIFASLPSGPGALERTQGENASLTAALHELDAFPALLWRNGRPVLQSGWHEEIRAQRKIGAGGKLQIAAFHDDNRHVAVFGRGDDLPEADYFQGYFSNGFAYDGASSSGWGTRVAFREKLADDLEWQAVYTFADALAPGDATDGVLRDLLHSALRHTVGVSLSARVPLLGTKVDAGYKWISGIAVSRVDPFGESLTNMDPFLHLGLRQPLPKFALGHWEAIADCNNLFGQGYVSMISRDGRLTLAPAFRSFRGGLTVQF
jgi:hypothetical protein